VNGGYGAKSGFAHPHMGPFESSILIGFVAVRRWGNGPRSALQASRACYGAIDGALRAACLKGGRSSLTLMV
jgi:hypothetical protein